MRFSPKQPWELIRAQFRSGAAQGCKVIIACHETILVQSPRIGKCFKLEKGEKKEEKRVNVPSMHPFHSCSRIRRRTQQDASAPEKPISATTTILVWVDGLQGPHFLLECPGTFPRARPGDRVIVTSARLV